jgi:hypothetical protein
VQRVEAPQLVRDRQRCGVLDQPLIDLDDAEGPLTSSTARAVSKNPSRHMNHPSAWSIAARIIWLPGSAT